jgi:hypothetical protein
MEDFMKTIISLSLAVIIAGLATGEAMAKRATGKKLAACGSTFDSDLVACNNIPKYMVQGLAQSVYDEAIRECENDAAARYDVCTSKRTVPAGFNQIGEAGGNELQETHENNGDGNVGELPGGNQ